VLNVRPVLFVLYYCLNCYFAVDPFAILLTLPMFILSVLGVSLQKSNWFSVDDMIWIIAYLFFAIGPLQALDKGYFNGGPVDSVPFTNSQLTEAMAAVFLFFFIFLCIHLAFRNKEIETRNVEVSERALLLLLGLNILAFVGVVIGFGGFSNLLATRYDKDVALLNIIAFPSMALQLATVFFIALVFRNTLRLNRAAPYVALAISVVLLAICQNPGNTPRYVLLASWLPIVYILFQGKLKASYLYILVFLSIIFAMPVLNLTSREGVSFFEALQSTDFSAGLLRLPFVDVFDMSAFQIYFMRDHYYYWGQKTLGLILFFIPREIWPTKATLAGLDLGTYLQDNNIAGTSNLSFFVAGDFYADGGLIAVIFGALAVSYFFCRVLIYRRILINGVDLRAAVLIAAIPILIRGPLGANLGLTLQEFVFIAILTATLTSKKEAEFNVSIAGRPF
jgi:hypothetical protein